MNNYSTIKTLLSVLLAVVAATTTDARTFRGAALAVEDHEQPRRLFSKSMSEISQDDGHKKDMSKLMKDKSESVKSKSMKDKSESVKSKSKSMEGKAGSKKFSF